MRPAQRFAHPRGPRIAAPFAPPTHLTARSCISASALFCCSASWRSCSVRGTGGGVTGRRLWPGRNGACWGPLHCTTHASVVTMKPYTCRIHRPIRPPPPPPPPTFSSSCASRSRARSSSLRIVKSWFFSSWLSALYSPSSCSGRGCRNDRCAQQAGHGTARLSKQAGGRAALRRSPPPLPPHPPSHPPTHHHHHHPHPHPTPPAPSLPPPPPAAPPARPAPAQRPAPVRGRGPRTAFDTPPGTLPPPLWRCGEGATRRR